MAKLICEVSEDPNFEGEVCKSDAVVDATRDGTVRVIIDAPKPNTIYYYRFKEVSSDTIKSRTGRAKTLPSSDEELNLPFRIGFATCADVKHYTFIGYQKLALEHLDLAVFLGDYIYGDTNECTTLIEYEQLYQQTRADPHAKDFHASVACFAIWDDHEVVNDYAGLSPPVPGFALRRQDAYKAFYEYFGFDETLDDYREIYRCADIGREIRLYLIDGRKYRDGVPCPGVNLIYQDGSKIGDTDFCDRLIPIKDGDCKDLWGTRSYLGIQQEGWLYDAFKESKATWNIIANNTMFCPLLRRSKDNELVVNSDAWSGYPRARNELVQKLQEYSVANPIFVTGDMHCFIAGNVTKEIFDPGSTVVAAEFVTSALAYRAGGSPIGPCDGVGYCDPDSTHLTTFPNLHRGFTLLEIGTRAVQVHFMEIDTGSDLDPAVASATFGVKSGTPGFCEVPPPPPAPPVPA